MRGCACGCGGQRIRSLVAEELLHRSETKAARTNITPRLLRSLRVRACVRACAGVHVHAFHACRVCVNPYIHAAIHGMQHECRYTCVCVSCTWMLMHLRMHGCGWVCGCADVWVCNEVHTCMTAQLDGWTDGRTDERTDGRTNRWTDRRTDRWTA